MFFQSQGVAFRRNENTSLVHPCESKQCSSGKHIQQNCVKDQHANAFQHLINRHRIHDA
ncbi:Uncharacterised protein [Shigella sonnei]|nr:Uncharacterised protein [Shigella sonnei]